MVVFFFQAEDGIRVLVRSRGLGDVYKRQARPGTVAFAAAFAARLARFPATPVPVPWRSARALSLIHI